METLALVAHNEKKDELLEWVKENKERLKKFRLIGTSSTAELVNKVLDLEVEPFGHGPHGGDILLAARILEDQVQRVIFFMDPHTPHSHEHDIQTLIRTAVSNNIPFALNRTTADFLMRE
ncbi:MAG: methylglyoxal synthase [Adhaeribacter sp.]|nr:methylglyoxal synthase [Adhaeribacter sp.]